MTERNVMIIGAGLAGLATGIYAQMNGYQTHIFEQAKQPRGVSVSWERNDYTVDGDIHDRGDGEKVSDLNLERTNRNKPYR